MNDPATAARYFQRAAAVPSPASDAREELQALWSRLVASASAGDKAGEQNRWLDEIEAHAASLHGGKEAANFWAQLGCRLKEGGKHIEAEKAFLKALELHPDDTDTLLQVGLIKLALDDPSSAALYLEKRWVHGHCLEGDEKPVEAEGACLSAPGPDETGVARIPAPRRLPCKLCGGLSRIVFGLPHNKKAGHPIPSEPDDCWYYQCDECNFLFTPALDLANHTEIYDDTYWKNQDPDWYGRVSQTFRLVAMANEMLKERLDQLEILDFGCGVGAFLELGRKDLTLHVWGTDINPPRVGKDWFLEDLGERKFDVITACEVIEHLPNPRAVFAKIRQHLKSPGVFAFQTGQWDPKELGRDWWYLGPHNGHISLYSREGLDFVLRIWEEPIGACGPTMPDARHGCLLSFNPACPRAYAPQVKLGIDGFPATD